MKRIENTTHNYSDNNTEVVLPKVKNENIIEKKNIEERAQEYAFIFTFFIITYLLGQTILKSLIYNNIGVIILWYVFIISGITGSSCRFVHEIRKYYQLFH